MNINLNQSNTFDAIIVGSGISGGWAAKELTEKGLKVLMLERGHNVDHPVYPTATHNPWDLSHRGRLSNDDRARCPVQSRHYSYQGDNQHYYINDLENPYEELKRYDWIRGDIVGGRSLLWARQSYRLSDLDFEANMQDGHGVDWPIRYGDLEPWYDYVESFIGVAGSYENIPHLPDGKFQPPFDLNCAEIDLKRRMSVNFPDRHLIIGRTANLTSPVKGRGVCQARNLCHRGCPYGAYFSTNASTLPAAFSTGNLKLISGALVNRVLYDDQKSRATGVEVIDTESGTVTEYFSKIIFLNASTMATTFLLLNSTSNRFPNGLGNDSDQVGRNIMDHHKGVSVWASVDGFEDEYYYGRRPTGIYIPRYRNMGSDRQSYLRGFGFQGGGYREGWGSLGGQDTLGIALKDSVQTPGSWQLSFNGFGECLPYADNRVTLNTNLKDKFGRNSLSMSVDFRENEKQMQIDMADSLAEMLEQCGYKNVRSARQMSFPGNANHEMGSARMGRDPKTSVLNGFNQVHDVSNVFITDGSCMTSSASVNPSLTYMALTARACAYAIDELKRQNL
jgi:hypothetical protein